MNPYPPKEFFSRRLSLILARLERSRRKVLKGGDPEALHDFRVALRRLRTCLRLLEQGYPPRAYQPVKGLLKTVSQTTNSLRDLEVSGALWNSLPPPTPSSGLGQWLRTQDEIRRMREKEVRDVLASPSLVQGLAALGKKLALRAGGPKTATLAVGAFGKEVKQLARLLKKTRKPKAEPALFHKLRVQAKRVRYSLEEFRFLLPGQAGALSASCKKVQNTLGDWRDMESALGLLAKAGNGLFPESRAWKKELKNRRRTAWKESGKALRALQKALNRSNL